MLACTSVLFDAIIFIFFEKNGRANAVLSAIFTLFSEIAQNAIQHNIRRNYLCTKIMMKGFFH